MLNKYLKYLIPVWTVVLVAFVYFGLEDNKLLPMLAVLFMAAGMNYANFKYHRSQKNERENPRPSFSTIQFEQSVKVAKPLRIIGMTFIGLQLILWFELIQFKYDEYVGLVGMLFLMIWFFLAVSFYNRTIKCRS